MARFKPYTDADYVAHTWFERDIRQLRLETPRGRTVVFLKDDEVDWAIESGFLKTPHCFAPARAPAEMWQPFLVAYAREIGAIK